MDGNHGRKDDIKDGLSEGGYAPERVLVLEIGRYQVKDRVGSQHEYEGSMRLGR